MKSTFFRVALALLISCFSFAVSTAQNRKPNILWIIAEDLNPNMGCYGDSVNIGHTPVIDKMANDGVLFKRAYATAPVCSASRSAFITGKYSTTIGTHEHRSSRYTDGELVPEELRIHLPDNITTVPELMREAGYFTFNGGKDDYNFDYDRRALYTVGSEPDYKHHMNGWQGNHAEHFLSWTEGVWSDREDKDQPWFGQVQIMGGKKDYKYVRDGERLAPNAVPLPPYFPNIPSQQKPWTDHYNAARGSDARIELILKQLEADGELENTIVFFFSDHGSPTSLRHKQFCYEGGLHVPLMVFGNHPSIKAGTVIDDMVTLIDVSATTLGLAEVEVPKYFDGQDVFAKNYKPVKEVYGARDRCDFTIDRIRTVRTEKYRYIRNLKNERSMMQPSYRDGKPIVEGLRAEHKAGRLTEYQEQHWFHERPVEELYDIAADPHQMDNLALNPEYQGLLKKHRKMMDKWIKSTDDKGQYPEDPAQLKATYELWKDRKQFKGADVNEEYHQFMGEE